MQQEGHHVRVDTAQAEHRYVQIGIAVDFCAYVRRTPFVSVGFVVPEYL